jgi:hypothetical protein
MPSPAQAIGTRLVQQIDRISIDQRYLSSRCLKISRSRSLRRFSRAQRGGRSPRIPHLIATSLSIRAPIDVDNSNCLRLNFQAWRSLSRFGRAKPTLRYEHCDGDWSPRRAVIFLDPYGMQVEWSTIEMISNTHAIDLWLLFPLGMGVNRLLKRSGDIPYSWRQRIDLLLGTTNWYEEFYKFEVTQQTLFGDTEERVIKASTATIGRYFNDRLGSIFAGVAPEPGVLRNSRNSPLYLLCFAVANMRGKDIALRIANHLLKEIR